MIKYAISKDAKILFACINPHHGSYMRGVPFSNNKIFWYLLNSYRIMSERMENLKTDSGLKDMVKKLLEKMKSNA